MPARAVALAALLMAGAAAAVPLEAGRVYQGPVTLEVEEIDASFQIGAGFTGGIQGELFILGHDTIAGMIAATARPRASKAELKAFLSEPIPLDDAGTVLVPAGAPTAAKGRVTARFKGDGVAGYAVARRHASGRAVVFIGATSPDKIARLKPVVDKLAASVRFKKQRPDSAHWREQLTGVKLHRYNTTSTTTSHRRISLCPDGTFVYRSGASGASVGVDGVGASFASSGGEHGTWRVTGTRRRGELRLTSDEGTSVFELRVNAQGHFLVDGERWLRDRQDLECR